MSKYRYTIEILASGQPRAYADSIRHVRVTVEETDPMLYNSNEFIPWIMPESSIIPLLERLQCGFMKKHTPQHWLEPRLDWLKPIDPYKIGDPNPPPRVWGKSGELVSHIWEFHVTSPFTD